MEQWTPIQWDFVFSKQWLWASIPLTLIGLIMLTWMISNLLKIVNNSVIVSVPLVAEQIITIDTAGELVLHGEGTHFTFPFHDLEYQLSDLSDNSIVPLPKVTSRTYSSGLKKIRNALYTFNIDRPGKFQLTVSGLKETYASETYRILITMDYGFKFAGTIVALVFSAIGLLGGAAISLVLYYRGT